MRQLNSDEYTSIVLGVEMLMHLVARNYCIEGGGTGGNKSGCVLNVLDCTFAQGTSCFGAYSSHVAETAGCADL